MKNENKKAQEKQFWNWLGEKWIMWCGVICGIVGFTLSRHFVPSYGLPFWGVVGIRVLHSVTLYAVVLCVFFIVFCFVIDHESRKNYVDPETAEREKTAETVQKLQKIEDDCLSRAHRMSRLVEQFMEDYPELRRAADQLAKQVGEIFTQVNNRNILLAIKEDWLKCVDELDIFVFCFELAIDFFESAMRTLVAVAQNKDWGRAEEAIEADMETLEGYAQQLEWYNRDILKKIDPNNAYLQMKKDEEEMDEAADESADESGGSDESGPTENEPAENGPTENEPTENEPAENGTTDEPADK